MTTTKIVLAPSQNELAMGSKVQQLIAKAEAMSITTEDDAKEATDLAKAIATAEKNADEERLSMTKPFRDGIDGINGRFKNLTNGLGFAKDIIRKKLLAHQQYLAALAEERRQEEEAAAEAERTRIRQMEEEAAAQRQVAAVENGQDDASLPPPPPVTIIPVTPKKAKTTTRSDAGATAGLRKVWVFEVDDIAKLAAHNPKLVEPKAGEIRKLVQGGAREIPGVRIFQDEKLAIR